MKDYECNFTFETVVETCGRDEDGAIENIGKILTDELKSNLSEFFLCGLDYYDFKTTAKEIENGWFQVNLVWGGSWVIEGEYVSDIKIIATNLLSEKASMFYSSLENFANKQKLFYFISLDNEEITDVLAI